MLHLLPQSNAAERQSVYAEAVARLASIRHAIRLVEPFGSGPAADVQDEHAVADAWDEAGEAKQRWFDRRSAALVGVTAAGLEALLSEREAEREPNREAAQELVEEIRRQLRDVAKIILD